MAASSQIAPSLFNYSQNLVPIFNGENYDFWSLQMKTLFISQELWELVEEGYEGPDDLATLASWTSAKQKEYKENKKKDAKALLFIQQGVSKAIFPRIMSASKSKDAWDILKQEFKGSEKVISIKLQSLWRDFDNIKMKDNESVKEFSDRVTSIINQIRSYGDKIDDKKIVEKILRSLPPTWDHIAAAIEESKDLSKLSFYELMASLESHELRRSRSSSQEVEQAFQAKLTFSRKGGDGTKEIKERRFFQKSQDGRGTYHERKFGRQGRMNERDKDFSKGKSTSYCKICSKSGHTTYTCKFKCTNCRNANHSQKDCWYQKNNEAHYTEIDTDHLFYSCFNAQSEEKDTWYLDSGCSNHMTGNKSSFIELKDGANSQIKLGDGKLKNAEGKGVIAVQTEGGKTKHISDVLYVPGLTQNLLSVGQLIQKGYEVNFSKNACVVIDKNKKMVARIKMAPNKVFPLKMSIENLALKTEENNDSLLWHQRYGHLNFKSLNLLKMKNMVIGLPHINKEEKVCEGCIYGKMHRLPFTKTSWRAKAPLELVHSDVCGPTQTPSLNGRRYFLLFVDDYSRMMWVYFLKAKSEVFSKFIEFKALVEKQSGHKLKILRTDRGGEFTSNEF